MNYSLGANNIKPHVDIEKEIQTKKNGLFTFILRVNNGNIVDCSVVEYVDVSTYLVLKKIEVQEILIKTQV